MNPFRRFTRRRFTKAVAFATGGLLFGQACGDDDVASQPQSQPRPPGSPPLARILRAHFDYLQIEGEVIDAFVRDLEAHQGPWHPRKSAPPFTRFLASTDFFQNGADERHALRYVRYYDPYVSPCYNPFAPRDAKGPTTASSSGGPEARAGETDASARRAARSHSA